MNKIIACTNLTLDGVMQAPGRKDEDTRDGFTHGGWAEPYGAMVNVGAIFGNTGALLFGRRTYEDFANVWPKRPDSPFTPWLNTIPKFVASHTLHEPLPWANSILLKGDLPAAINQMKQQVERDVLIMGSGDLIRSLMQHALVDEFVLLIHPLVLGSGRRLFSDGIADAKFELVSSTGTPKEVIVATYKSQNQVQLNG